MALEGSVSETAARPRGRTICVAAVLAVALQISRTSPVCSTLNESLVPWQIARFLPCDFPRLSARRVATHPRKSRSGRTYQRAV